MNYQTIPGFEDIHIGYGIKKIKKNSKNEDMYGLFLYWRRKNKQTETNKKQTALCINFHDITHHTQHTARKKKVEKKVMNK